MITALSLFLGLGFIACSNEAPITGTWIQPAAEGSSFGESGFTLNEDGTVTSINMGYRQINAWERDGDQLTVKGNYTGSNPRPIVETYTIAALTEDSLALKDEGDYIVTYQRKTATTLPEDSNE